MVKPLKKFQLGKRGLTDAFIEQIKKCFENAELIKVEILKNCCRNKEKARKIGDELVEKLGRNFNYRLVGYVLSVRKFRKPVR